MTILRSAVLIIFNAAMTIVGLCIWGAIFLAVAATFIGGGIYVWAEHGRAAGIPALIFGTALTITLIGMMVDTIMHPVVGS